MSVIITTRFACGNDIHVHPVVQVIQCFIQLTITMLDAALH